MVFGGLSERYELSSLKSAGVSLLRVMAPAIVFATGVALFSFFCSNTLNPLSNLKFQSRLYDMRNQKPALSLAVGIFNDDFKGYSIHIGRKDNDNRHIYEVVIYDQSTTARRQFNVVTADRGEMFLSDDGRDFVMKLYDGYHYQEVDPDKQRSGYPFTRTKFTEWTKLFSLSEFELNYTDEELFKEHHTMKSVGKLIYELDTIDVQYGKMLDRNLYDFKKIAGRKAEVVKPSSPAGPPSTDRPEMAKPKETVQEIIVTPDTAKTFRKKLEARKDRPGAGEIAPKEPQTSSLKPQQDELIRLLDSMDTDVPWDSVFAKINYLERNQFVKQGLSIAKSLQQNSQRLEASLKAVRIGRAKHVYELHSKFCFAVICVIFLFIGAPMGAIVRKGGFGYPLLVAVIFFTMFILLTLMFKKLAETEAVDPVLAAWMPCMVMIPISAVLTYKALNDARMMQFDRWIAPVIRLIDQMKKQKKAA
jgi:lipopolysaccharide export system permease protein